MAEDYIDVEIEDDKTTTSMMDDEDDKDEDEVKSETSESEETDAPEETASEEQETGDETDAEREAIRERRRAERARKKERVHEREDTLKRELASRDSVINQMREELNIIQRKNSGSELAQIDNSKREAAQAYQHFKDQIRLGTEQGDGDAVANAAEKMMVAQRRFDDLTRIETAYRQRSSQPAPLDPRLVDNAKDWMDRNKWYDLKGKGTDDRVVQTIDQTLAEEGFDPTTKQYWEELDTRVKKYLPHRIIHDTNTKTKPKSVVSGSGRESSPSGSKNTFRVSAERVQAIKDVGAWDDQALRNKMIKSFRDYDKLQTKE